MKKILSIDDEPAVLKCFATSLGRRGYELLTTSNPEEGLRIVRENDIALALLDIRMPEMNGFEFYRKLRAIRRMPVLFVTAYPKSFTTNSDELVQMWKNEFADGTTDIVYKPFELDVLFDKVEALIGMSSDSGDRP